MKLYYPQTGITVLCKLFGKTRHAWYDNQWRQRETFLKDEIIIQLVLEIRNQLLRIAARKLMFMLKPKLALHGLRTGRDYLFDLLAKHKLLIRTRKITTTNSRHWMHKYKPVPYQKRISFGDLSFILRSSFAHETVFLNGGGSSKK